MKALLLSLIACSCFIAQAQNYYQDFSNAFEQADTAVCEAVLQEWEQVASPSAEYYTSAFNFHYWLAQEEVVQLNYGTPPENEEVLIISDSLGNPVGFMASVLQYDEQHLEQAFAIIDDGIERFPNRLDMHFGKIYLLGELQVWEPFTGAILNCLDQSEKNDMLWAWTLNEPAEISKDDFLGSIQEYQASLYFTGEDSLLPNIVKISEKVLNIYPGHLESISNLGAVMMLNEQPKEALKYLKQAENINKVDPVVLSNIAYTYIMLKDYKKAKKYYKKVLKYGSEEDKAFAQSQLEQL